MQRLGALVDAGKYGNDIRPQNIKGVLQINFTNPEREIRLLDLHIVIEYHGKFRVQIFPGPADAQIIAPGKTGVLPV